MALIWTDAPKTAVTIIPLDKWQIDLHIKCFSCAQDYSKFIDRCSGLCLCVTCLNLITSTIARFNGTICSEELNDILNFKKG